MVDAYTKVVLTVIAVMLTVIAVREIPSALAGDTIDVRIVGVARECSGVMWEDGCAPLAVEVIPPQSMQGRGRWLGR